MPAKTETAPKGHKTPTWGMTFPGSFPESMRRMVWPLCCGFSILSGFKSANFLSEEELLLDIETCCSINGKKSPRLDFQVFGGEMMDPNITFLTLNSSQMASEKIMKAIGKAGFVRIGIGRPRGSDQGLFMLDRNGTFTTDPVVKGKPVGAKTEAVTA